MKKGKRKIRIVSLAIIIAMIMGMSVYTMPIFGQSNNDAVLTEETREDSTQNESAPTPEAPTDPQKTEDETDPPVGDESDAPSSIQSHDAVIVEENTKPTLFYKSYVQDVKWQDEVPEGQLSGTTGQSKGIEAIAIRLDDIGDYDLGMRYQVHLRYNGWQDYVVGGKTAGKAGSALPIEAIKIELTGSDADKFDVYYRIHAQNFGDLDWAMNGQSAGSAGFSNQLEGIIIQLLPKGSPAPGPVENPYNEKPEISYAAHVQDIGWQKKVPESSISGTQGKGKRMEALTLNVEKPGTYDIGFKYQAHVQNMGWQDPVTTGQICGTTGKELRIEALRIELTGADADKFDVYYQVHAQNYGDLSWAKNGQAAGTTGLALRVERVIVKLQLKGLPAPGSTAKYYYEKPTIAYASHIQNIGWQNYVNEGNISGTIGHGLRMEGLIANFEKGTNMNLGFQYQAHVQDVGWQNWVNRGVLAGTGGQSKRMEAVKIRLTGADACNLDIYYQVHVQNIGWMDWASNGGPAGTENGGLRIEAIRIRLVPKGSPAPGPTGTPYRYLNRLPAPTCIIINIDAQNMKYYVNNHLIVDTPVTTGTRGRYDTPRGTFMIYSKSRNVTLRGPGYASFVNYWMPFYRDYGIHDATWRSQFGGSVYLSGGSHGCVNTPFNNAQTIFTYVSVGTPVIVQ